MIYLISDYNPSAVGKFGFTFENIIYVLYGECNSRNYAYSSSLVVTKVYIYGMRRCAMKGVSSEYGSVVSLG